MPDLTFVVQEPQLGTAHALLTTEPVLASKRGLVVLLSGDVPLLTTNTLEKPGANAPAGGRGGDGRDRNR